MSKIAKIGPQNVTLLNDQTHSLETGDGTFLTIDEELFGQIEFVKQEHFSKGDEVETLEIAGNVRPILGVIQEVKENLLAEYPLSATEVARAVKERLPDISRNTVWKVIKDNDMKNNTDYSAYNFRNRKQEETIQGKWRITSRNTEHLQSQRGRFHCKCAGKSKF